MIEQIKKKETQRKDFEFEGRSKFQHGNRFIFITYSYILAELPVYIK